MSIVVKTSTPAALLEKIKDRINKSKILYWEVDSDGDFTYTGPTEQGKAWLRPRVRPDGLVFSVITPTNSIMSAGTYAHYHTSWSYTLLLHFDSDFSNLQLSALPADGDIINSLKEA